MATKKAKQPYQYEPLVTPSSWRDDEQRFSIRLTQIIDDLYQKYSGLRQKTKNMEPSTPTDEPVDADTLNGKTADDFLAVDGTAVNTDKLGGKSPKYYLPAYNLLDNSYFERMSEIVNQRGFVSGNSVSSWEYFIDRWINTSDSARVFTLTDNGMGLEADTTLCQRLEGVKSGTVLTLAACSSDGTIVVTSGTVVYNADGSWSRFGTTVTELYDLYIDTYAGYLQTIVYTRRNVELKWAALYEGEYTAETLPKYVPKGYAAELLECQRYFVAFKTAGTNGLILGTGYVANTTTARVVVPLAIPMRTKPTITSLNSNIYAHGNGKRFDVTNLTVLADAKKQIILQFNLSASTTASSAIMLGFSSPDNNFGYQAFSADL